MNYLKESRFEGSVLGFIGYYLIMTLLTIFTLGIAYPWGYVMFQRWLCRNTVIDGHRLYFDGTGTQLFGNYIKWWFFTLITVGIYGLWLYNKMTNWRVKHTHMVSAGDSIEAWWRNWGRSHGHQKSREFLIKGSRPETNDFRSRIVWRRLQYRPCPAVWYISPRNFDKGTKNDFGVDIGVEKSLSQ